MCEDCNGVGDEGNKGVASEGKLQRDRDQRESDGEGEMWRARVSQGEIREGKRKGADADGAVRVVPVTSHPILL